MSGWTGIKREMLRYPIIDVSVPDLPGPATLPLKSLDLHCKTFSTTSLIAEVRFSYLLPV